MPTDDELLERLARARTSYAPTALDAESLIDLGHRARRRRTAMRWASTAAVVASVGVLAVGLGGHTPSPAVPAESNAPTPITRSVGPAEILSTYRGLPEGAQPSHLDGALLDERAGTIVVWTWGSGSCPDTPTWIDGSDDLIEISVAHPTDVHVCTADSGPTTFVVDIPDELAPDSDTLLRVVQN